MAQVHTSRFVAGRTARTLRRMVALTAAAPLVLLAGSLGGPLAGVASAVTTTLTATSIPVLADPSGISYIGPNAGFLHGLDPAHAADTSIKGVTPLIKVDTSLSADPVTQVRVTLARQSPSDPAISIFRDFDSSNGFALYQDVVNAADPNCVAGTFDSCDLANGQVSNGFTIVPNSPAGTVTLDISLPSGGVSGASSYFIGVHPAAANTANRPVAITLNSFRTASSASATPPPAQNVTIDSVAPASPSRDSFTPQPQFAGTEDDYQVGAGESGKQLLFFASPTSVTAADVLHHPGATPDAVGAAVLATIPQGGGPVLIGDGTGISPAYGDQPAVTVANNGQTSDNVYPRAVDFAGNLSGAANLDAGDPNASPVIPNLQNDVTAPSFTLNAVTLSARGVNADNNTAGGVAVFVSTNGTQEATSQRAQLIPVDPNGVPTVTPAPTGFGTAVGTRPVETSSTGGPDNVSSPVDPTKIPNQTRFGLEARIFDHLGNSTVALYSPHSSGAFTTTYLKDGTRPVLSVAQVDQTSTNGTLTLIFSKPMAVDSLAAGPIDTCSLTASNCPRDNITATAGPSHGPTCTKPDFGVGGSFAWVGTVHGLASRAVITLGSGLCVVANGDTLTFTTEVQDEAGNHLDPLTKLIATGQAFPIAATTLDLSGSDNYGMTDGHLDAVDVTFNTNVTAPAAPQVQIRGTNEIDPVTSAKQLNATTIRFFFTGGLLTDALPFVEATAPSTDGGVTSASAVVFGSIGAADGAAPVLLSAVTRDTNGNGKIDQLVLTWSEPIDHSPSHEAVCGYTVAGYEDHPAGELPPTCTGAYNTIASGTGGNKTVLTLKEIATGTDTGARPTLNYNPNAGNALGTNTGTMPADLVSPNPNVAPGSSLGGQVTDGVPPLILSRVTRDLNNNGKLDAIDLTYSEDLNSLSLGNAIYTVEGHAVLGVSQTASNHVQVLIDELPPTGTGDTGALPKVTYVGGNDGGLQDANSVPATPDTAPVAPTDGAGPALVAAQQTFTDGTPNQVRVVFSEPVKASTVSKTSFKVVNGTSGDLDPTDFALSSDRLSAVLTLAAPLDHNFDTAVRFSAAMAVTDDQGVPNTQTGPVIAPREVIDGTYHAVNPARLVGTSSTPGLVGPNSTLTVQVDGRANIPSSGVRAVVLNLQTFQPTAATYITAYPAGLARPSAANLTARAGQTISNLVTVLVGPGADANTGKINLYNKAGTVSLFADVVGYYAAPDGTAGSTYEPIQPARLLNTHNGFGGTLGPLSPGQTITLQAGGRGGIPATGVSAVAVHVMIQSPTASTYLTTFPTNVGRPQVATVTAGAGVAIADLSIAKLGPDGAFNIYNKAGYTHVVVDVVGYYDAGSSLTGSVYRAAELSTGSGQFQSPVRIVNSTTGLGRFGALGPGESFDLSSDNVSGLTPSGVAITGYIMNVEVGQPTANSYITAWPSGAPRPQISQQTFAPGGYTSALVQVGVSSGGKASVFNKFGFIDVFVDLSGFFISAAPTNA